MNKIILTFFSLLIMFGAMATDVIGTGTAWIPQATPAGWSVSTANELIYSGIEPVGAPAVIATTFDGLTAGANWSYYAGLTLTFDAYISGNDADTTYVILGAKDVWASKKGVRIEVGKNGVQVMPNGWIYTPVKLSTDDGAYQAAVVVDAYNSFIIKAATDGTVSVSINGYLCPATYAAGNVYTTPMNTSTPANRPALFGASFTGFKLKNLVAVKEASTASTSASTTFAVPAGTKSYFTHASGINDIKQSTISIYPSPSTGDFSIYGEEIGQKYQITNVLGQQIKTGIISANKQPVDLTSEKAGTYMVVIQGDNGNKVKQIIKN